MSGGWRYPAGAACAWLACIAPGHASDSTAALLACRDIADSGARLACFDRAAAALAQSGTATARSAAAAAVPSASGAAAPPAPPTVQPAPVLSPQQQFGLPEHAVVAKEVAAGTRAADATKIEAHLLKISAAADGRFVFTLDNDQVWKQLLTEGDLLAKPGELVTISRGLLGSYWLQAKSGRGCKVTRVH